MGENINGFQGAVAGLSLADVIQLKGHNRYTGCITVSYGNHSGTIFFINGEIVHAEQGSESGERAIFEIIRWPGGTFSIHPEMTTNVCTIHCRTDYLLLDAFRRLDEDRAGTGKEEKINFTPRRKMSKVAAALQEISAVTYAVLLDKQGTPVQDSSIEAGALAGKGLFLATTGNRLGALLGLGDVKAAAVQTTNFGLLMYDSRQHYLSIAINPGCQLDSVESEIRNVLIPPK
ncbi:DUF4388 domain-containing protein [Pelotalea chapellei]|uniref:DUF4388 domain-containing protein n=1 Tax=Pelotalea chapellei TaxID=44671 RepID=A0ABS5U4N0_9BACT|nr:DUF4388 domain-containing protein [Pelotalea chapellei]MBT1070626.1 DUF4388 domain-containing protein [Pelotalea chapellei]